MIFVGDNGTPREVCLPPFLPEHAKLTMYEGALGVPLIFRGPAAPHGGVECTALVNTSDLFATVLDLAGVSITPGLVPGDSVSLAPYLADPTTPSIRTWVYAEMFNPNGTGRLKHWRNMMRGERFKLIRKPLGPLRDEYYDLQLDPFETNDLLAPGQPPLTGPAWDEYRRLDHLLFSISKRRIDYW